jgi:hypothetical protein
MARWRFLAAPLIGPFPPQQSAAADSYNPAFEWQIGPAGLVCSRPSAIREALAALYARDLKWLSELGCEFMPQGTRIVLIDAPITSSTSNDTWFGRIYPNDGRPAFNAYFQTMIALTYTLLGPFRSQQDAVRETAPLANLTAS